MHDVPCLWRTCGSSCSDPIHSDHRSPFGTQEPCWLREEQGTAASQAKSPWVSAYLSFLHRWLCTAGERLNKSMFVYIELLKCGRFSIRIVYLALKP